MHEMGSDGSSRAENWTDLRKNSMRVFFGLKNPGKKQNKITEADISFKIVKKNEVF